MKIVTNLTSESVSILTVTNGKNHRRAYSNSESGRMNLVANEPKEVVEEIMVIWGNTPTIEEPSFSNYEPSPSSNVWDEIAGAIRSGVNEV